jgi:hypothetical protein
VPGLKARNENATRYDPIPHTSKPTHSKGIDSPFLCPGEHNGSVSNVRHGAEEPVIKVSSRYKP